MLKVALIAPYSKGMNTSLEEIGICSIASYLRENGYEVLLTSVFENTKRIDRILEYKPDIIGMPVYNHSKKFIYELCGEFKGKLPESLICLGGSLPTFYDKEILNENALVDLIIRGEGEQVWLNLLRCLEKGESMETVKGITFRNNVSVIANCDENLLEDINKLPFPARDLFVENKLKIAHISNSRGCSGRCTFCCSPKFWSINESPKYRGRDICRMVDEIEYLAQNYGARCFSIIDNSFEDPGSDYDKVLSTAREINKRNLRISYYLAFRAEFHKKVDDVLLEELKRSGLCSVYIGVETANENDRRLYRKIAALEDNDKSIKLFRDKEIIVSIGFINFNPYSTFEGLRQNIDFLGKYGFASQFTHTSRLRIYKGTELYKRLENDGMLKAGSYDDEYGYRYVDDRVEKLALFINNYFSPANVLNNVFYNFAGFYASDYLVIMKHYKRIFEGNGDSEASSLIDNTINETGKIFDELNDINVQWYKELLDLAESNWDNHRANKIMGSILSTKYMNGTISKMEDNKGQLYKKIASLRPQYLSYLV